MILKQSTRYILVTYAKPSGHKNYYRRAGVRFIAGQDNLVDVQKLADKSDAETILRDSHLNCRQLTEKGAEKHLKAEQRREERKPDQDAIVEKALLKARDQLKTERDRCETLELQSTELLEQLETVEHERDQLRTDNAELHALLDAAPTTDADAGDDAAGEG